MGDFDDWEEYNFMWTQWKSNKILSIIKPNSELTGVKEDFSAETSALSTQITTDSSSSVENLLTTPTKRKRTSTVSTVSASQPITKKTHSNNNSASKSEQRLEMVEGGTKRVQ